MATAVKPTKETRLRVVSEPQGNWLVRKYILYGKRRLYYRVVLAVLASVYLLVIVAQLLYPVERGLPFARVGDQSLMLASHEEMAQVVTESFAHTAVELTVGNDKTTEFLLKSAGAEPNTEAMIAQMSDYPWWQRIIPGTILRPSAHVTEANVYFTNEPFKKFMEQKAKELSFPPKNARLTIKDGKIEATDAVRGSKVDSEELLRRIGNSSLELGGTTTIEAPSVRTVPQRIAKDLEAVRSEAEAALAHTVTIRAGERQFSPDRKEIAAWLVLSTSEDGNVSLSVDKEKVKAYLYTIDKEVGAAPGQTNITIVDGREVGRTTGAIGRSINVDELADRLSEAILRPPLEVAMEANFVEIQPSVIFNSRYTATQDGLRAYVSDVAWSRNMRISIQQLDGERWSAAAREHESIPSGSTYKLYVSLVLFDRMKKGEIHWDDPMLDTTVAGCFERMTVASTNPCAEQWIAEFGRPYINDFVHARGFGTGTSFTTGYANQTTAADLTKFMIGLNDGSLVGGPYRERLLDSLGRHPYRYGIPAGSQGRVYDKVGFLWDYIHDTAIVHHPRGTYIMTIMTKGQSYGAIAGVTREVERIMYP